MSRLLRKAYIDKGDKNFSNYTIDDLTHWYMGFKNISYQSAEDKIYGTIKKAIPLYFKILTNNNIDIIRKAIARLIHKRNIKLDFDTMTADEIEKAVINGCSGVTVQELAACFDNNSLDDLFRIILQILTGTSGFAITSMSSEAGKSLLHYIAMLPDLAASFTKIIEDMAKKDPTSGINLFYLPGLYDAGHKEKFDNKIRNTREPLVDRFNKDVNDNAVINDRGREKYTMSPEQQEKNLHPVLTDAKNYKDNLFSQVTLNGKDAAHNITYPVSLKGFAYIDGKVSINPMPETVLNIAKSKGPVNIFILGYLTPDNSTLFVDKVGGPIGLTLYSKIKAENNLSKIYMVEDKTDLSAMKMRRLASKL